MACRKTWPEGVAERRGRKTWSEGVAERRGRKTWLKGVAEWRGRKAWPERRGRKAWLKGVAEWRGRKAWPERRGRKAWLKGVVGRRACRNPGREAVGSLWFAALSFGVRMNVARACTNTVTYITVPCEFSQGLELEP